MSDVIKTSQLTKYYGGVHAVDGISLSVGKGEIYGFLGLNGAGKTTTIRMLLGMIRPTAGVSFLDGRRVDAGNYRLWEQVGYLVEIPYSYPELTVRENLEITRRLHYIADPRSVEVVIEKLQLGSYAERKTKNLSLGNAQRLGLAKALLHHPKILILDEPANGLDPAGMVEVRELLRDLALNHGVTIFISSHILGEISKFATRIGIIHQGRLIQEVDTNQLDHLCQKRLLVKAHDLESVRLKLMKDGYAVNMFGKEILEITSVPAINHPEEIATLLVRAGLPPTLLQVEEEDLESYFLRTIGMNGGEVK
jgi:ABC-2 type transport system ATP-binding protein